MRTGDEVGADAADHILAIGCRHVDAYPCCSRLLDDDLAQLRDSPLIGSGAGTHVMAKPFSKGLADEIEELRIVGQHPTPITAPSDLR